MTWSDHVDSLIASETAAIAAGAYADEACVEAPTVTGWGASAAGITDIDVRATVRPGTDPLGPIEALIRRFNTGRGDLPEENDLEVAEYGLEGGGVYSWLGRGFTRSELAIKEGQLRIEAMKDDRFAEDFRAELRVVNTNPGELEVTVSGTLVSPDDTRPFNGVLAITSAGTVIKDLSHG